MTNKEIINSINSSYQLPTDEQILQVLKAAFGITCPTKEWWDNKVRYVKEHYYD